MLYRTMLDNENMEMQDPQYIPNVNETDSMQQFQTEPQRIPYMDYPMMDDMYDPSTYDYQMQQYQMPEEDNVDMERAPKHDDSYNHGYNEGFNHGYNHGYGHGFNHGHQNFNHHQNFPLFPFILPFLFFRD